ncbi:sulfite reductase (NADPH) flavoprotein alpha-component [Sphingobacterium allocomposti]|uniref:Sulfite reductase (NADPH) flavoprotein alpha-component n=1 Tax=Sphingobacterium allocomposti TaxID=415956 RepID=A0A5S5DAR6_9SPHI|nr:PepSY domain-containing protein [Sphingobacterium composti Yoo et al. 2007 non Ten et al. 2007]TYP91832.1 sulfite reductase (NADPH) flavoprotein alpha-component [Sphingobacterium composti Yoo et al. 2007 non Ten et al. 2007]
MTLSIWRYAHLALALVSSLFLLILSVTGVILAFAAVEEKTYGFKVRDFGEITLAQTVDALQETYPEVVELTVDHNQFVAIDAFDENGEPVKGYIDPRTGAMLGELKPQSDFVQWNIALHRSLFLKETGRAIVGVVSFLLFLITISGVVLIAKRQQGLRNFFAKINKDSFSQYFHVVTGRLFLIPVLLLALTGTYLFMVRMGLVGSQNRNIATIVASEDTKGRQAVDFPVFQETFLADVEKVEFPFVPDDPEEHYVLKLRDRELVVNQITGTIVEEIRYPYSLLLEKLSLDLHTGRTSVIWAVILGFASLNILFFVYTGFAITIRRKGTTVKNKFNPSNANYVILVGSENGSTWFFANKIHQQLLALGQKSFLTDMNRFAYFPEATHLLIFSSTYGLGTAPANAVQFEKLVSKFPQRHSVRYSVVGFGSKAYPDFCAYAKSVDTLLSKQGWAVQQLGVCTVNDRSVEEFLSWGRAWSSQMPFRIDLTPALYTSKITGLKTFSVLEKTAVSEDNATFRVVLRPQRRRSFQSGDLLAIYPGDDGRERLYSIAKVGNDIQLMVKLHPDGLGSSFLYRLEKEARIKGRIIVNKGFHFPTKAPAVAMIANGTGIAPFLGMIAENRKKRPIRLYVGFRHGNALTEQYHRFAQQEIADGRLAGFNIAFSRGDNPQYVMDLVRKDADFFRDLLESGGVVMICGSLAMQKDIEQLLAGICAKDLTSYGRQILTDCY